MMGSIMPDVTKFDDIYRESRRCCGNSFVAFVFCVHGIEDRNRTYQ
jgi:hypothetical protein